MSEIRHIEGRAVVLLGDEIDTDRIIPARYLKVVTFEGLGDKAFFDERYDEAGRPTDHVLNQPHANGASILIVGRNFGCGSSREHAPQALYRAGFRAIVGESFAEIFSGNSLALGLTCVDVERPELEALAARIEASPDALVSIDLDAKTVAAAGRSDAMTMPEAARQALLRGQWDSLALLSQRPEQVKAVHDGLPYTGW